MQGAQEILQMGTFNIKNIFIWLYTSFYGKYTKCMYAIEMYTKSEERGCAELAFHAYYVFKAEFRFCKMLCFVAVIK